ncbi:MAG: peptide deformylase [Deltaproteobacteria bacterium]|nr:peptide deformylase [Deltaproteobacteria bacterium]
MTIRKILHYPDKRLRVRAEPVQDFGPSFQQLIEDMAETMYAAEGVGLAAPQIGVPLRVFAVDTAAEDEPSEFRVFANPQILEAIGEVRWEEGCLSFPGIREEIERAECVRVSAMDRNGKPFELWAEGLLAIAIQHELDHLNGTLIIDRVGPIRRRLIHREMMKALEAERASSSRSPELGLRR